MNTYQFHIYNTYIIYNECIHITGTFNNIIYQYGNKSEVVKIIKNCMRFKLEISELKKLNNHIVYDWI